MTQRFKLARSADPAQQHLRDQKKLWNKSTRELIAKLIAFKRGLNGTGDPRVGIPASKIQNPLPQEVGSYLNQIADDYAAVIHGAEQIISEQEQYSQVRRKPQTTPIEAPQMAQDGVSAVGITSTSSKEFNLFSESSWFGSRLWANTIGLRGKDRKYLKMMLRACDSIKDHLIDLENILSSSYQNAIKEGVVEAITMGNLPINNLITSFNDMMVNNYQNATDMTEPFKDETETLKLPTSTVSAVPAQNIVEISKSPEIKENSVVTDFDPELFSKIKRDRVAAESTINLLQQNKLVDASTLDLLLRILLEINPANIKHLKISNKRKLTEQEINERNQSFAKFVAAYTQLLSDVNLVFSSKFSSFREMFRVVSKLPKQSEESLKTNAGLLSRRFKQFLLRNLPTNKKVRDQTQKQIITIESSIMPTLNSLEILTNQLETANSNPKKDILPKLINFIITFIRIYDDIIQLAMHHNAKYSEEILTKKPVDASFHKIPMENFTTLKRIKINLERMLNLLNPPAPELSL